MTSVESRALELLGDGIPEVQVANCLGVDPSRISQLMGQEEFAAKVMERRYNNLQAHTARDNKADTIEDSLLTKLENAVPLMFKPMEILKAYQTINSAKRRGQSAPAQLTNQQTVVNLLVPQRIIQQFVVNPQNQVVKAGDQELLTMQSGPLLREAQEKLANIRSAANELETGTPARGAGNEGARQQYLSATVEAEVRSSEQSTSRAGSALTFIPVR